MVSLVLACAIAGSARAQVSNAADLHRRLSASCRAGRYAFKAVLYGTTPKPDDQEKEFGSPFLFLEKGRQRDFAAGSTHSAVSFVKMSARRSACRGTLAFLADRNTVGVVFKTDDRPMPEQLGVVFYDARHGKVLAMADRLGAFTELKTARGALEFRSMISRTDTASGLETRVKGRVVVLEEDELRPWYRVSLGHASVVRRTEREATWASFRFKSFFKTREEFERAFGFDQERSVFTKLWVYVARLKDSPDEACLLPSAERRPTIKADSPWVCGRLP